MAILQWNSQTGKYEASLVDGSKLIVDGDVYVEQMQAGVDPRELEQSATWENCLDGERVYVEKRMGRPSQGRDKRIQAQVTLEIVLWLEGQKTGGESLSDVIFRLLDGLRQAEIS